MHNLPHVMQRMSLIVSIVWLLAPQLECAAAVLSPSTGIIDSHALMLSLQGDFKNAGGLVVLNSTLAGVFIASAAIKIIVNSAPMLNG